MRSEVFVAVTEYLCTRPALPHLLPSSLKGHILPTATSRFTAPESLPAATSGSPHLRWRLPAASSIPTSHIFAPSEQRTRQGIIPVVPSAVCLCLDEGSLSVAAIWPTILLSEISPLCYLALVVETTSRVNDTSNRRIKDSNGCVLSARTRARNSSERCGLIQARLRVLCRHRRHIQPTSSKRLSTTSAPTTHRTAK